MPLRGAADAVTILQLAALKIACGHKRVQKPACRQRAYRAVSGNPHTEIGAWNRRTAPIFGSALNELVRAAFQRAGYRFLEIGAPVFSQRLLLPNRCFNLAIARKNACTVAGQARQIMARNREKKTADFRS